MIPTFELIEDHARPSRILCNAMIIRAVCRRIGELAEGVTCELEQRHPEVLTAGPTTERARVAMKAVADAEALVRWMDEELWPVANDRAYASRLRSLARRRFRRALRRLHLAEISDRPHDREADDAMSPLLTYRPAERWLELYAVLCELPADCRPESDRFVEIGAEDLWDWAAAKSSLAPRPEPNVWSTFVAPPATAGLVAQLLPVWVGLMGTPRLGADEVLDALAETGMLGYADQLQSGWDEALVRQATKVPYAALTLLPSCGSWPALAADLQQWREARQRTSAQRP